MKTQLSNVPILIAHPIIYCGKHVELQGHRAGVRAIALSRDNSMVMMPSKQTTKIWRIRYGYGICRSFVQGDQHAVVGTKEGELKLFSLGSGDCIFSTDAHEGSIWSLAMRPDKTGFATGSADKTVKFWEFDVDDDENLTIVHTRTLKMTDEVMCLKYSHAKEAEKLLIAIALLDCTVKVFYEDTLKFSLSLYGHKLPVMSLDISSDDTVITTASADKNVNLWVVNFDEITSTDAKCVGIDKDEKKWTTNQIWTLSESLIELINALFDFDEASRVIKFVIVSNNRVSST
eukprot:GSMAST32.ASY1.ANO1.2252.1 assembled CDS